MRASLIAMTIWHGVNENLSFIPMCFGRKQNLRKQQELHFTFFSCSNRNLLINPILIPIEFQHTTPVESCLGSVPHAGPP